jgi:ABC-2 type transport system permease protein
MTPFLAIVQAELRMYSRRIAPYFLIILSVFFATLWTTAWSTRQGWAINSDYFILRNYFGFTMGIMGLPLFAAVIMSEPVIRDFRLGIDPLIFSKPISRLEYLLGKFFGAFCVLVCSQASFALTLFLFQIFHTSRMVVLPFRVFPYVKHFVLIVVISYLLFAAVYFTVGALTRNAKIVYGLAVAYYPLYVAYQLLFLKGLPRHWKILLDPLIEPSQGFQPWRPLPTAVVDSYKVIYTSTMITNRFLVILASAVCLLVLYLRFRIAPRSEASGVLTTLNLTTDEQRAFASDPEVPDIVSQPPALVFEKLPSVSKINEGPTAKVKKLLASLLVELQLLRDERGLVALVPLFLILSVFDLAFYQVVPEISYSATYASKTARILLLFICGITVFFMGETMHRDREERFEPMLWAAPIANTVLLLSKFSAVLLLTLSLTGLVGVVAIVLQLVRGHTPVNIFSYVAVYSVIVVPSAVLVAGISLLLNIALREKYLAYLVSIAVGGTLLYLYNQGYNHWSYNPLLYQLWNYADLNAVGRPLWLILLHRGYCLAMAIVFMLLAHLLFRRKSATQLFRRRLVMASSTK